MRDSASMPKLRQNSGVSGVHSRAPLSSPFVSSSSEAAMAIMNNSCNEDRDTNFCGFPIHVMLIILGPMSDRIDDVISDTIEGWSDV